MNLFIFSKDKIVEKILEFEKSQKISEPVIVPISTRGRGRPKVKNKQTSDINLTENNSQEFERTTIILNK